MNCPRCNKPIDEHEAGQETNMCVAVVVFEKNEHYYDCPHFSESGRLLSFCSCPDLPCYSTSISAAWVVVEKMKADKFYGSVNITSWKTLPWNARFWSDFEERKGYASCDTAPLAICRAAIKATHCYNGA